MEYKMRKQETAEAMGRGRDTLTRRIFPKDVKEEALPRRVWLISSVF